MRPRDPKTGYDRDLFAYRSVDLDRNGCDTRNDILRRDLRDVVLKPGTHGCVVLSGVLHDPFTGDAIVFERGDSANLVQIDHVVALSDAWQKGAQHLAEAALHGIGNDPLNLLAVYGPANQQKGDGDAATWLPRNKSFRCAYVARQVAVKHAYGLWVVQPEKDAIERVLAGCPHEPLPDWSCARRQGSRWCTRGSARTWRWSVQEGHSAGELAPGRWEPWGRAARGRGSPGVRFVLHAADQRSMRQLRPVGHRVTRRPSTWRGGTRMHPNERSVPAARELRVAGMQRRVQRLGKREVRGVVARVPMAQAPDPLAERPRIVAVEEQVEVVLPGLTRARGAELAAELEPA